MRVRGCGRKCCCGWRLLGNGYLAVFCGVSKGMAEMVGMMKNDEEGTKANLQ
jgi:hypothetical protein